MRQWSLSSTAYDFERRLDVQEIISFEVKKTRLDSYLYLLASFRPVILGHSQARNICKNPTYYIDVFSIMYTNSKIFY